MKRLLVAFLLFLVVGGWWFSRYRPAHPPVASSNEQLSVKASLLPPLESAVEVPGTVAPGSDVTMAEWSPEERTQLSVMDEILVSKNDNDPRLDTVLRDLSPALKRALREKYRKLAPEQLNEKGTLVFVLGRELKFPEDVQFLSQVTREPNCLSLADCRKEPGSNDPHHADTEGITLDYPKLVAVKAMERALEEETPLLGEITSALKEATRSASKRVAVLANRALRKRGE